MSGDEISFGEVTYRAPERLRRPDRDRRWACIAHEVPGADDLPIFLDLAAADAIERHALRDTSVELGGILLGKECVDDQTGEPFVWITQSLEAKHYENTQASFTYTHDSWEEISRERDERFPDLDIVGWYHTHPDFGVFLSGHDLFIHQHFFAPTLQVAYVVDPIRQTRGFFQWRDGSIAALGGFHLIADRNDRAALTRFVNDLENIPNTGAGGGGLSPRLEAELIAMLSRPTMPAHSPTADRLQLAALFGTLGVMLGVVGVAAVLWMNSLFHRVQDQTQALQELDRTLKETSAAQRLAFDALLAESEKSGGSDRLIERYEKLARDRDGLRTEVKNLAVIQNAIADHARELERGNKSLKEDLEIARKSVVKFERDAKEAPDLRKQVERLSEQNEAQARRLQELEAVAETAEGKKASQILARYDRAWWVSAAGWALAVVLGLGLIAAWVNPRAHEEPAPEPAPPAEPPHLIS